MRVLLACLLMWSCFSQATLVDIDELYGPPDFEQLTLSPDGKLVLYVENSEHYYLLGLLDVEQGQTYLVKTYHHDNPILNYQWIDNNRAVLQIKVEGYRAEYILDINRKGESAAEKFTISQFPLEYRFLSIFPDKPEHLLVTTKARGRSNTRIGYIPIEQLLIKSEEIEFESLFSTRYHREQILFDELTSTFIAWKVEEEEITILARGIDDSGFDEVFTWQLDDTPFTPVGYVDEETMLVISNEKTDKKAVYEFNVKQGKLGDVVYQHDNYDIVSAEVQDGNLLSIKYFLNGSLHTEYLINESSEQALTELFSDKKVAVLDESESKLIKLLYVYESNDPGAWYYYDQGEDYHFRIVTEKEALTPDLFSISAPFTVTSQDGLKIEALYTPASTLDQNTLIVMPHGGPVGVRDVDMFDRDVQYLANRGFSVLRVNFRGSAGFGKEFQEHGVGELGGKIEKDINLAVDHLLNQKQFKHICAMGYSYGGYSSVVLALQSPERYQCVVAGFGIYDVPLLFNNSNYFGMDEIKESIEATVGSKQTAAEKPSPVWLADKLEAPILLVAGMKDKIAYFEHSNRFKYMLDKYNKDVESIFYKYAGHGLTHNYDEKRLMVAITDFIERKLNLPKALTKFPDAEFLKHEYAYLGDIYSADYLLEQNDELALAMYQKAAELGEPRSLFNVGSYYHRGDVVEKNNTRAMEYYHKAADAESEAAYRRLAEIYTEASIAEQDLDKAWHYLNKLDGHDVQLNDYLTRAQLYCFSDGVNRDIDKCTEQIGKAIKHRRSGKSNASIRETVTRILLNGEYSPDEFQQVKRFLNDTYEFTHEAFTFTSSKQGLLTEQPAEDYRKGNELVAASNDEIYSEDVDVYCAQVFSLDLKGIDSKRDKTGVLTKWEVWQDGKPLKDMFQLLYGDPYGDYTASTKIDHKLVQAGKSLSYELYVYDLMLNEHSHVSCEVPVSALASAKKPLEQPH